MKTSRIPDIKAVKFTDSKAQARAIRQQLEEMVAPPKQEVVVCSLPEDCLVALAKTYERFNAACLTNNRDAIATIGSQLTKLWNDALSHHFLTIVERTP